MREREREREREIGGGGERERENGRGREREREVPVLKCYTVMKTVCFEKMKFSFSFVFRHLTLLPVLLVVLT